MISLDIAYLDHVIPKRCADSHKDDYGRVLAVCGSTGYTGAAYFSAQAAVCTGSGVVTLLTPSAVYPILACKLAEPVVRPIACDAEGKITLDSTRDIIPHMVKATALLIGCGIGRSSNITDAVITLLQHAVCPIILDADGLNALEGHIDVLRSIKAQIILTPHMGELARLVGKPVADITDQDAINLARDSGAVVLLKSHRTRIITPDGVVYVNTTGNPGMAKGGSGDVLAGIILSLCGQGLLPLDAAAAGAYIHGAAGDICANAHGEYGMTPRDILSEIGSVLRRYNTREW